MIPFIVTFFKNYSDREQISGCQGLGTVEEVGGKGTAGDLCYGRRVKRFIMNLYVWWTVMEFHTKTAE